MRNLYFIVSFIGFVLFTNLSKASELNCQFEIECLKISGDTSGRPLTEDKIWQRNSDDSNRVRFKSDVSDAFQCAKLFKELYEISCAYYIPDFYPPLDQVPLTAEEKIDP